MSKLLKSKILLGVMIVAVMVVGVAMFATSASAEYTMTLKQGMRNAEVSTLQTQLGVTPVTGYFGPITKAAVMAFQANNGLTADGIVGPMTRAALNVGGTTPTPNPTEPLCPNGMTLNSNCTIPPAGTVSTETLCPNGMTLASNCQTAPNGGTTPSTLTGTDGTISDVNELSSYNNEEIGDGSKDVKVLGMDVVASKDGDVQLKSVKVSFDATGNTGSSRLADYLTSVAIYMGSTKVATVSTADFTKDSTGHYSKIITLDSNVIVKADKTEKFYVAVDAVSNLDSGDITGDSWTVDVENIRYVDGSGVVTTETDYDLDGMDVPMSFVSFSTSADTKLKISLNSSPASAIVPVDTDSNTDNVLLLKGKMKLEGTSMATLNELPIDFDATGATKVSYITGSVKLVIDQQEFTETMATNDASETITFDNLDLDIEAGKTIDFEVYADVNDLDADFEVGDSLKASLTSTNRDDMDIENAQGDQLSDSTEKTGVATGEAQYFYETYAKVESAGAPTISVVTNNEDVATVTFKVKVTAVNGPVYLNGVGESTANKEAFQLSTLGGGAGTSTLSAPSYTVTGATTNGNSITNAGADNEYYTIAEDQSVTFTITATITQTVASTTVGAQIDNIQFGVLATDDTSRALYDLTWAGITDQFETSQVTLVP